VNGAIKKRRQAELAKIHVAKKRLGLDDETYRQFLMRETGKSSAAELDQAERSKVLDIFKQYGFVEGNSHSTRIDDFKDAAPQHRLIRALWAELQASGALRDGSEIALRRFIKRCSGCDSIKWLGIREGSVVIEGLKVWKRREQEGKRAAKA
jgi:phage gp16-like protein